MFTVILRSYSAGFEASRQLDGRFVTWRKKIGVEQGLAIILRE